MTDTVVRWAEVDSRDPVTGRYNVKFPGSESLHEVTGCVGQIWTPRTQVPVDCTDIQAMQIVASGRGNMWRLPPKSLALMWPEVHYRARRDSCAAASSAPTTFAESGSWSKPLIDSTLWLASQNKLYFGANILVVYDVTTDSQLYTQEDAGDASASGFAPVGALLFGDVWYGCAGVQVPNPAHTGGEEDLSPPTLTAYKVFRISFTPVSAPHGHVDWVKSDRPHYKYISFVAFANAEVDLIIGLGVRWVQAFEPDWVITAWNRADGDEVWNVDCPTDYSGRNMTFVDAAEYDVNVNTFTDTASLILTANGKVAVQATKVASRSVDDSFYVYTFDGVDTWNLSTTSASATVLERTAHLLLYDADDGDLFLDVELVSSTGTGSMSGDEQQTGATDNTPPGSLPGTAGGPTGGYPSDVDTFMGGAGARVITEPLWADSLLPDQEWMQIGDNIVCNLQTRKFYQENVGFGAGHHAVGYDYTRRERLEVATADGAITTPRAVLTKARAAVFGSDSVAYDDWNQIIAAADWRVAVRRTGTPTKWQVEKRLADGSAAWSHATVRPWSLESKITGYMAGSTAVILHGYHDTTTDPDHPALASEIATFNVAGAVHDWSNVDHYYAVDGAQMIGGASSAYFHGYEPDDSSLRVIRVL